MSRGFRQALTESSLGTPHRAVITARWATPPLTVYVVPLSSLLFASLPPLSSLSGTVVTDLSPHRLYGDQRELDFWSVAQYYLLREKYRLADPRYQVNTRPLYHISTL